MNTLKYIFFLLTIFLFGCHDNLKKEYYANGSLKSKYYADKTGLKYGPYVNYKVNGRIKSEFSYINDTLNGIAKEYYSNGQLSAVGNFKNGLQDGRLIEYYSNGKLLQNSGYKFGERSGLAYFYYQNGALKSISYAKNAITQYKFK